MTKSKCGICLTRAVQRVLTQSRVMFRCEQHEVDQGAADEQGWKLFTLVVA